MLGYLWPLQTHNFSGTVYFFSAVWCWTTRGKKLYSEKKTKMEYVGCPEHITKTKLLRNALFSYIWQSDVSHGQHFLGNFYLSEM